jgi:PilZ domain
MTTLSKPQSELRAEPRRRVLFEGLLVGAGGRMKLPCMVRDMSPTGARIYVSEAVQIPESFEFSVNGQSRRWNATVRWRKGGFIGLKLRSGEDVIAATTTANAPTKASAAALPPEGTSVADLLARIDGLERENHHLKKLNRELRARYEP